MCSCSWSLLWEGDIEQRIPYISKLADCNYLHSCDTRDDTTVIQLTHTLSYDEACGFVKGVTDSVQGDATFVLRPAADAEVVVASAAADALAAIDDDDVADTPPPAVEFARLLARLHHLTLRESDTVTSLGTCSWA